MHIEFNVDGEVVVYELLPFYKHLRMDVSELSRAIRPAMEERGAKYSNHINGDQRGYRNCRLNHEGRGIPVTDLIRPKKYKVFAGSTMKRICVEDGLVYFTINGKGRYTTAEIWEKLDDLPFFNPEI